MRYYTTSFVRQSSLMAALICASFAVPLPAAFGEVGKGHRILMERGLQTQGMVTKDDVFHLDTYRNANYTAINWLWDSNPSLHGPAPGFPWARWVGAENQMPGPTEQPYLSQLVALQLGDEWHLNDPVVRNRAVDWFNAVRNQWPNTILYMNNWGGQVNDSALADFVSRARPDMLSFDTYPFKSNYTTRQPDSPAHGSPTNWYSELRRYRAHAKGSGIPFAIYRQTFHAVQDYDQTVYRDPSPSELNLNTFGALAFNAKYFIDFTYNTGASSLFTPPGGDTNPRPAYAQQADINRRARNLGKALVHLEPIHDLRRKAEGEASSPYVSDDPNFPTGYVTSIQFHRGRWGAGSTSEVNPLPSDFYPDPQATNTYSWWEFGKNDPYLTGWTRTNLGTVNNGQVGDAIFAWFKPLDSALDDPNEIDDQLYLMVVNGLTSHETTVDARQQITLDFRKTGTNGKAFPGIVQLNADTGLVEPLMVTNVDSLRVRLTLTLDGGAGALLKFNTGSPFIMSENLARLHGDFNSDGAVDAADYVFWRKRFGASYTQADYNAWRRNFGETWASGNGVAASREASNTVPEPSPTLFLVQVVALAATRFRVHAREQG